MEKKPENQNSRLPQLKDEEVGKLLGVRYRSMIIAAVNALFNFRLIIPYSDGSNVTSAKEADVKISELGMVVTLPPMGLPGSGGSSGSSISCFRITALSGDDYITCRTWDGSALGSTDIFIAKPWNMRPSLTSEVIDGTTITYTWTDDNARSSTDGTDTEDEKPLPRYVAASTAPYDIIWAQAVDYTGVVDGSSNPITWLEISPSRNWQGQT